MARRKNSPRPLTRRARRGFTLVELVIVGALIALFSSLAIFGVQQQFRSNLRKAAIGESRQIAQALDFANLDTSIFPKLCFLTESREGLDFLTSQLGLPTGNVAVYATADINARNVPGFVQGDRIRQKWNGPYFALSQSRTGVAQGRGGWVYMILPDLPVTGPNSLTGPQEGIRWPADPWNNPYVVYMLDVDNSTNPSVLRFVNERPANETNPTPKGNFANAVVSYGPNHYPGGDEFAPGDFGVVPGGDAAASAAGAGEFGLRLYKGFPNFKPANRSVVTHTLLTSSEYTSARASIWSRDFNNSGRIGITDIGSDDVIFEF